MTDQHCRTISTAVYFGLESSTGEMINAQHFESSVPQAEEIATTLEAASIEKPDGTSYTFVSDQTAISQSTIRSECLTFHAQGSVSMTSVANITEELKASVLQAQPGMVHKQHIQV